MRTKFETVRLPQQPCTACYYTVNLQRDMPIGVEHIAHIWHKDLEGGVSVYYWCRGHSNA